MGKNRNKKNWRSGFFFRFPRRYKRLVILHGMMRNEWLKNLPDRLIHCLSDNLFYLRRTQNSDGRRGATPQNMMTKDRTKRTQRPETEPDIVICPFVRFWRVEGPFRTGSVPRAGLGSHLSIYDEQRSSEEGKEKKLAFPKRGRQLALAAQPKWQ